MYRSKAAKSDVCDSLPVIGFIFRGLSSIRQGTQDEGSVKHLSCVYSLLTECIAVDAASTDGEVGEADI